MKHIMEHVDYENLWSSFHNVASKGIEILRLEIHPIGRRPGRELYKNSRSESLELGIIPPVTTLPAGQTHFSAQPVIQITRGGYSCTASLAWLASQPAGPAKPKRNCFYTWLARRPISPSRAIQITGGGYSGTTAPVEPFQ